MALSSWLLRPLVVTLKLVTASSAEASGGSCMAELRVSSSSLKDSW